MVGALFLRGAVEKRRGLPSTRARHVANRRARANSAQSADAMEGKLHTGSECFVGGGTDL